MPDDSACSRFSAVGQKLTAPTGILALMEDLGRAMTTAPDMLMLGGGNPAAVPEMQRIIRARMAELLADGDRFDRAVLNYDPPRGNPRFIEAVARLLRDTFGWPVSPANIAVTNGGQTAYFMLLNLLAGRSADGGRRKVLLPLAPEYIGYADQCLEEDAFVACRPSIALPDGPDAHRFKYHVDFAAVEAALSRHEVGVILASRPTNPTGNVLTDEEVRHLSDLAQRHGVPLVLDHAYGPPFPGVVFTRATPYWAPHTVLTLSLSKLGLPGMRTGVIVAPEPIAAAVASMTAVVGLANGTIGQQIALPWVESGEILDFGPRVLRPFYEDKSRRALTLMREVFAGKNIRWAVHESEGAFFHWLWLRNLSVSTAEFYERLKRRKVLIVPGEYFFFGLQDDWPHRHECVRINFSQPEHVVRQGLSILAEEAARAAR